MPPPPTSNPWPGDNTVRTVDAANTFSSNLSGLTYETPASGGPVLWAVRNGPGSIYRMVLRNGTWVPDTDNGWSGGKSLRYPDGTGEADAEGLTLVNNSAAGGAYVASERNNSANAVSRNSILRYDVSGGSTTLTATHEWNLTADDLRGVPALDIQRHLVLAFKEMLHNIRKHAEAKKVQISLSQSSRELTLDISDDGIGFDSTAAHEGHGLASLRQRAIKLGGELRITTAPGKGTQLVLTAKL
jgi:hypothetical protein